MAGATKPEEDGREDAAAILFTLHHGVWALHH